MAEAKVGWARLSLTVTSETDPPLAHWTFESEMRVGGNRKWIKQSKVYSTVGDRRLLEASETLTQGDSTRVWSAKRQEGHFLQTDSGAEGAPRELPLAKETLDDKLAIQQLATSGGHPGTTRTVREFEPRTGKERTTTAIVDRDETASIDGVTVKVVHIRIEKAPGKVQGSASVTSGGVVLVLGVQAGASLRLEDEEVAKDPTRSVDLISCGLVRLDKKLGSAKQVTGLSVRLTGLSKEIQFEDGPHQSCVSSEGGGVVVTTGVAKTGGAPRPVSENDMEDCVRATSRFPAADPKIVATARDAVKDATSAEGQVRMLLAYVSEKVRDDYVSLRTGLDVLREQRGDCTEHVLLFVSLCRALRIPAREVRGFVYVGDAAQALGAHAWAEVSISGCWVAVDPTWNQAAVDATHLSLARQPDGKYLPVLGLGVSCTVLACERRE